MRFVERIHLASDSKQFKQTSYEQLIKSVETEYNLIIEELKKTNKV